MNVSACKIEEPITFTNLERTLSGFERENKIVKSEFQLENHTPHLILTSSNVQQNKVFGVLFILSII